MFDVATARQGLQVLIGEPFTGVGRALDMGIIAFGDDLEWLDTRGNLRIGSEYAIHVQCPFRVSGRGRLLVGSEDMHWIQDSSLPAGDQTTFDRQRKLLDKALALSKPRVVDVALTELGDILLNLSDSLVIEIFPASARRSETWRFFQRNGDHLVFPGPE